MVPITTASTLCSSAAECTKPVELRDALDVCAEIAGSADNTRPVLSLTNRGLHGRLPPVPLRPRRMIRNVPRFPESICPKWGQGNGQRDGKVNRTDGVHQFNLLR